MSFVVVEGRFSRHLSFCHLDNFHYTALHLPFLSEDLLVLCLEGGRSWICCCVEDSGGKGELVHLLYLLSFGRIARMFTLRLNSLSVLETWDVDTLSRAHVTQFCNRDCNVFDAIQTEFTEKWDRECTVFSRMEALVRDNLVGEP